MSSDTWGAATFALGVLVTAHSAAVFGQARPPAKAVVWTATSSERRKASQHFLSVHSQVWQPLCEPRNSG